MRAARFLCRLMENNRRFLIAIALTVLVIVATQILFPPPKQLPQQKAPPAVPGQAAGVPTPARPDVAAPAGVIPPAAAGTTPGTTAGTPAGVPAVAAQPAVPVETVTVSGTTAAYQVSTQGAALVSAEMLR